MAYQVFTSASDQALVCQLRQIEREAASLSDKTPLLQRRTGILHIVDTVLVEDHFGAGTYIIAKSTPTSANVSHHSAIPNLQDGSSPTPVAVPCNSGLNIFTQLYRHERHKATMQFDREHVS